MNLIIILAILASCQAYQYQSKIHSNLLKSMSSDYVKKIDILLSLGPIDEILKKVAKSGSKETREERATTIYTTLTEHARFSHKPILNFLKTRKSLNEIYSFWISNLIWVQGASRKLILELSSKPEIFEIFEDGLVHVDARVEKFDHFSKQEGENAWGIEKINCPAAWNVTRGEGVIVGVIDTGTKWTHKNLVDTYSGGNSWFDPYGFTEIPDDGHGHGTHVTGTICGSDGIGVAPGASYISCKGLTNAGTGSNSNILKCFQFMVCPHGYDGPDGNQENCTGIPDMVSNSWVSGAGNPVFNEAIKIWHEGSGCSTISSPADSPSDVISVGATDNTDTLAEFSSHGPVRETEINPHISAPGVSILSCGIEDDNSYGIMSGTSMATPHVAGVLALMKSANPGLKYGMAKTIIQMTCIKDGLSGAGTCGDIPETDYPNDGFGHGRIDAKNALFLANKLAK